MNTTRRKLITLLFGATGFVATGGFHADAVPAPAVRIATIGSGTVGRTLAQLWVDAGYHVMLSARTIAEAQAVAADLGPLASAGTPQQAVAFGDVVLLAVPYGAIPSVAQSVAGIMKGKVLLDATNPYRFRDGAIASTAGSDGAGVTTQRYFPEAKVVRGFNSIDMSAIRTNAHRTPPLLAIPIAGDDHQALATISSLVTAAGFDPVVVGDLKSAMKFQPGHDGFEMQRSAPELRQALGAG